MKNKVLLSVVLLGALQMHAAKVVGVSARSSRVENINVS